MLLGSLVASADRLEQSNPGLRKQLFSLISLGLLEAWEEKHSHQRDSAVAKEDYGHIEHIMGLLHQYLSIYGEALPGKPNKKPKH